MATPIVHGGIEKAASSLLQQTIFPNLTAYRYLADYRSHLVGLGRASKDDIPAEAREAFQALADSNTLISSEGFVCLRRAYGGYLAAEPSLALLNLRDLVGGPVRLLLVLRRQDSAVESMVRYKQRYFADPHSFLADFPAQRSRLTGMWSYGGLSDRLLQSYNYDQFIAIACGILGAENISILLYEDLRNEPLTFYKKLGDLVGEDLTHYVTRPPAVVNSTSSKYDALPSRFVPMPHLVRRLNNLTKHRLEKVLPQRDYALPPETRSEIRTIFAESNRRLSQRMDLDLDKYGYF